MIYSLGDQRSRKMTDPKVSYPFNPSAGDGVLTRFWTSEQYKTESHQEVIESAYDVPRHVVDMETSPEHSYQRSCLSTRSSLDSKMIEVDSKALS